MDKLFCAVFCCCCFFLTKTYAQEELIWLTETPVIIDNAFDDENVELTSSTTMLMLSRLKDVKFSYKIMSLQRIKRLMSTNENYCVTGRIQTPARELAGYFTQPVNLYMGIKFYYPDELHPLPAEVLDKQGDLLSLKKFLDKQDNGFLTIEETRSYGTVIDKNIAELAKDQIDYRSGLWQYKTISAMLLKGRLDFALVYPSTLYEIKQKKGLARALQAVNIKDANPYIIGRIMCSKTAYNLKVINKINRILDDMYQEEIFYQLHINTIQQSDISLFNKYFNEVFKERNF